MCGCGGSPSWLLLRQNRAVGLKINCFGSRLAFFKTKNTSGGCAADEFHKVELCSTPLVERRGFNGGCPAKQPIVYYKGTSSSTMWKCLIATQWAPLLCFLSVLLSRCSAMEPHAKPMQAPSHLQRRHPLSLLSEGRDGVGKKVNKYIKASSACWNERKSLSWGHLERRSSGCSKKRDIFDLQRGFFSPRKTCHQ